MPDRAIKEKQYEINYLNLVFVAKFRQSYFPELFLLKAKQQQQPKKPK